MDFRRFWKYSSAVHPPKKLVQLEAKITARYHNVEKGLALADVRLGFGQDKIERLFSFLDEYVKQEYDQNRRVFQTALSVLEAYIKFHKAHDFDVSCVQQKIQGYDHKKSSNGGTKVILKEEIVKKEQGNFSQLALNRHSIRNFSDKPVPLSLLKQAVKIAQKAPSVCNRQSGRAHVIKNSKLREKLFALHKGNKGFGHLVDTIIIVTSDMRTFTSVGERNQAFIDGSLFGMTLIYALHSFGLTTCALNWSVTHKADMELHTLVQIPEHEQIVFLIAVGNYPEVLQVAQSTRCDVDEVIKIIV